MPNQIADYVNAALAVRMRPRDMVEVAVDADLAARSPRAERYLGWPMLLAFDLAPE